MSPKTTEWLRTYRTATWLAWQIETNWIDPLVFTVYSIVRPLAGAAIIAVMYMIIAGTDFTTPMFAYMYIGNAMYIYVGKVLNGMFWATIDDRERYRTLKYVYTAPISMTPYLLGRSTAQYAMGTIAVVITLAAGIFGVHLPIHFATINWGLLFVSIPLGIALFAMLGLLFAGPFLLLAHQSVSIADAATGALLLFTGAVFPLDILPAPLQAIGYALPVTYWIEAIRRSLIPASTLAGTFLNGISDLALVGILLVSTVVLAVAAHYVFQMCDRAARERGLIDRVSNY